MKKIILYSLLIIGIGGNVMCQYFGANFVNFEAYTDTDSENWLLDCYSPGDTMSFRLRSETDKGFVSVLPYIEFKNRAAAKNVTVKFMFCIDLSKTPDQNLLIIDSLITAGCYVPDLEMGNEYYSVIIPKLSFPAYRVKIQPYVNLFNGFNLFIPIAPRPVGINGSRNDHEIWNDSVKAYIHNKPKFNVVYHLYFNGKDCPVLADSLTPQIVTGAYNLYLDTYYQTLRNQLFNSDLLCQVKEYLANNFAGHKVAMTEIGIIGGDPEEGSTSNIRNTFVYAEWIYYLLHELKVYEVDIHSGIALTGIIQPSSKFDLTDAFKNKKRYEYYSLFLNRDLEAKPGVCFIPLDEVPVLEGYDAEVIGYNYVSSPYYYSSVGAAAFFKKGSSKQYVNPLSNNPVISGKTFGYKIVNFTSTTPSITVHILSSSGCEDSTISNLKVEVSGGYGPFLYSLNNNLFSNNAEFDSLHHGIYLINVKDSQNNIFQIEYEVPVIPNTISVTTLETNSPICSESFSGEIHVAATTTGDGLYFILNENAPRPDGNFDSLPGGIYSMHIIDDAGCAVFMDSIQINENDPLLLNYAIVQKPFCGNKGSVKLYGTGTGDLLFSIDNLDLTTNRIYTLAAGEHKAHMVDQYGCRISMSFYLPDSVPEEINCNLLDDNCNGITDEGTYYFTYYADYDLDFYGSSNDSIIACENPGLGFTSDRSDCDDFNALINASAAEICNQIDDNCDGQSDEGLVFEGWYADLDLDGFGNLSNQISTCKNPGTGFTKDNSDCNDSNSMINSLSAEICNQIDDNCDGNIDEGLVFQSWYADADLDGFGDAANQITSCENPGIGYTKDYSDCDDLNSMINSASQEICNRIDDNCDGNLDEGLVFENWYADVDIDGFGDASNLISSCENPGTGYSKDNTDCNDLVAMVHPGANEICNEFDDDCDGNYNEDVIDASISVEGTVNICKGELLTIAAVSNPAYVYQWLRNGMNISGATNSAFTVSRAGKYSVLITMAGGCFAQSEIADVSIIFAPQSVITNQDGVSDLCLDGSIRLKATTGAGYTYRWFKNATVIAGQTTVKYNVTSPGSYTVETTNLSGCQKLSNATEIFKTCGGFAKADEGKFVIFPNPSFGHFSVKLDAPVNAVEIVMYDFAGIEVMHRNVSMQDELIMEFDEKLIPGVYLLAIKNGMNELEFQKLIIQ